MRRTVFMALFAALAFLLPANSAFAQSNQEILRDCADDGILEGDYSASAMRKARNNIPAELDEYSDCRDVLSREISAKTAASNNGGGSAGTGGGGTGGGGGGGALDGTLDGGGSTSTGGAAPDSRVAPTGRDPGIVVGPSTPQDWSAIDGAARNGDQPVTVNGRKVSPAASVGRNGLPGTMIAVLALLAVAAVAASVPLARRRVVARTTA